MSVEGSADGSFELDEEWIDDGAEEREENDYSLDDLLDDSALDRLANLRVAPSHDNDHESTTADFVNTLIEEGLFSPPLMTTSAFFEDQPEPRINVDDHAPFLSTPSLGDSVHATPLLGSAEPIGEVNSAGIPYGRSHHAERAALAHALPPVTQMFPLEQPKIPHSHDHHMLRNADAAQPSLPQSALPGMSHQEGAMFDPFITIQTVTKVLSSELSRSEGGIPLGRTSHAERVQATRMLATQNLGLGMPRSPAVAKDLTDIQASPAEEENEMLFDASFEMSTEDQVQSMGPTEKEESSRRLPKPPKPQQLDLPSPVKSPAKQHAELEVAEKRVSLCGMYEVPS